MQKIFTIIITFLFVSCGKDYIPKPRGYFRIDLPEKEYIKSSNKLPYKFEYPKYSYILKKRTENDEKYWIDMIFPYFKASVHFSYKVINKSGEQFFADSREFVYKHAVKADAIVETPFIDKENKVYGMHYEIKGDAASNVQFYLTDSSKNFIRGALYFNVAPNKDSLAPVLDFINQDIVHLMETLEWN